MRYKQELSVIGFMVFVGVCNAQAPVPRAEDAIRYRRAVMVMVKWHYDRLSHQTKGSVPFVREEAQRNAAWLETLSQQAAEGFVPGSHEGDTKALPSIWAQGSQFRAQAERFRSDAAKLNAIARAGGDAAALKAQMNEVTRTCKSCHDDFKKS